MSSDIGGIASERILVEKLGVAPIEEQRVEVVERKGTGHPDYIADSISEAFSRNLSRYYLNEFGRVLEHNVDVVEIRGGRTETEFGGGRVIRPFSILFSGIARDTIDGVRIPLQAIALDSAKDWLTDNLRYINSDSLNYGFNTESLNGSSPRSREPGLQECRVPVGIGYAPLSYTEEAVLNLEKTLNSRDFKKVHPYSGEDIFISATRRDSTVQFNISNAFLDRYVSSIGDYFDKKAEMYDSIDTILLGTLPEGFSFKVGLNSFDQRTAGKDGCSLAVTGTSAENGNGGITGRGNRTNGLTSYNRLMPVDTYAGRNPVTSMGKIYNILAFQMAGEIFKITDKEVLVKLIGNTSLNSTVPVSAVISVEPSPDPVEVLQVREIVDAMLDNISRISMELIQGGLSIF